MDGIPFDLAVVNHSAEVQALSAAQLSFWPQRLYPVLPSSPHGVALQLQDATGYGLVIRAPYVDSSGSVESYLQLSLLFEAAALADITAGEYQLSSREMPVATLMPVTMELRSPLFATANNTALALLDGAVAIEKLTGCELSGSYQALTVAEITVTGEFSLTRMDSGC